MFKGVQKKSKKGIHPLEFKRYFWKFEKWTRSSKFCCWRLKIILPIWIKTNNLEYNSCIANAMPTYLHP